MYLFLTIGVTAVIKAVCAEPCLNKCPPKNLEFWHKRLGRKISNLLENITLLPHFFPQKIPYARQNLGIPLRIFFSRNSLS